MQNQPEIPPFDISSHKKETTSEAPGSLHRRQFLERLGAAATLAAGVLATPTATSAQLPGSLGTTNLRTISPPLSLTNPRLIQSYDNRVNAATAEALIPVPQQRTNVDQTNFPNHIR